MIRTFTIPAPIGGGALRLELADVGCGQPGTILRASVYLPAVAAAAIVEVSTEAGRIFASLPVEPFPFPRPLFLGPIPANRPVLFQPLPAGSLLVLEVET